MMVSSESVVVSYRQMHGSAPARRTYHRPDCPRLKARHGQSKKADYVMTESDAVAAGYRACDWCIRGLRFPGSYELLREARARRRKEGQSG